MHNDITTLNSCYDCLFRNAAYTSALAAQIADRSWAAGRCPGWAFKRAAFWSWCPSQITQGAAVLQAPPLHPWTARRMGCMRAGRRHRPAWQKASRPLWPLPGLAAPTSCVPRPQIPMQLLSSSPRTRNHRPSTTPSPASGGSPLGTAARWASCLGRALRERSLPMYWTMSTLLACLPPPWLPARNR